MSAKRMNDYNVKYRHETQTDWVVSVSCRQWKLQNGTYGGTYGGESGLFEIAYMKETWSQRMGLERHYLHIEGWQTFEQVHKHLEKWRKNPKKYVTKQMHPWEIEEYQKVMDKVTRMDEQIL